MSKKNERVQRLIALDKMIRHQSRKNDGSATFNKEQLDAAMVVIKDVLQLDNISFMS